MAGLIYALCALTSFLCACMLLKSYWRSQYRLLLWGGLCFAGLSMSNMLLMADKLYIPQDLSIWRHMLTLASLTLLLYSLILDTE